MTSKSIIPCLNYKNATNAIEWLCNAFGFQKHLIVPNADGKIIHAELTLDNIMIMVGSSDSGTEFSKLIKHPSDIGGFQTQCPYIILDDKEIDEHYKTAKKNGAKIIVELKEEDYEGKNYSCYDLEGHLWSFGSYDPWNTKT